MGRPLIRLASAHHQAESIFHRAIPADARRTQHLLRGPQFGEGLLIILAFALGREHRRDPFRKQVAFSENGAHAVIERVLQIAPRAGAHVQVREFLDEGRIPGAIARRILDSRQVRIFLQAVQQLERDRNTARTGDVIQVDRNLYLVEEQGIIFRQPFSRRLLVIEGRDHQQPVGAVRGRVLGKLDGLREVRSAGRDEN